MAAVGFFNEVILSWTNAINRDVAITEVWRSDTNDLGTAFLIQSVPVNAPGELQSWSDAGLTAGDTWYYWLRHINGTGIPSVDFLPNTPLAGWSALVEGLAPGGGLSATQEAQVAARISARI